MSQLGRLNMQTLLKLLLMLIFLNYSNAASPITPSNTDELLLFANTTDLSATDDRRFITAVRNAYSMTTTRFPKAQLMGVQARFWGQGTWQIRVIFTNPYRSRDRSIIVTMGPTWGHWRNPTFEEADYSIFNKILFLNSLTMDVTEADQTLRDNGYLRVEWDRVFLYWLKQMFDFPPQPYYIFFMKPSIFSAKYLSVGIFDKKVYSSNSLPEPEAPEWRDHGYLTVP